MTYSVTPVFPMPLYKSSIAPIDPITLNRFLNFKYEEVDGSYTHKETLERHILNRPEFSAIKKDVMEHVNKFLYEVVGVDDSLEWYLTTSWVNKAEPGEFHGAHFHSNSLVSGVLYLKVNPKSGAICFHKATDYINVFPNLICIDYGPQTDYNAKTVATTPKPFDIILFPSVLTHSVLANESGEDRYSLAFNVFCKGTTGAGGNSELTL